MLTSKGSVVSGAHAACSYGLRAGLLLVVLWSLCYSNVSPAEVPPSSIPAAKQAEVLKDADPTVASNKRIVYDFIREVLIAGRLDRTDRYLDPIYVQHSPGVATGRQGFIEHMKRKHLPNKPVEIAIGEPPLVSIVGDGDKVVVTFIRTKDTAEGPRPYCHFDMFRLSGGKIVEHWDSRTP
jgi:predicted SnoaL-like aldol condensation-catalyzing enzyme